MDTFRAEVKALLAADSKEDTEDTVEPAVTYPEKLTSGYYRVRKTWKDSKSQVGAYRILSNAKAAADKNPGTFVFANDGTKHLSCRQHSRAGLPCPYGCEGRYPLGYCREISRQR